MVGTHPYPLNELLLMTAAACRLKPSVVFDWGTHIGASARIFYECDKAFNLSYEIHSIDLPPDASHVEHPGEEHGRLVRDLDKVHLHRGDGVNVALEQWQKLGRPKKPLFFVDGDHAYESVRDELNKIFSTVPDASALAHDTFFQSAEFEIQYWTGACDRGNHSEVSVPLSGYQVRPRPAGDDLASRDVMRPRKSINCLAAK